jgi:uncharacterized membrane protein
LAVLFMVLWHVIDSWTVPDWRSTAAFPAIGFMGGWAAPLFLFLAGVSVPLAGAGRISRGATRAAAGWSLQKRGWQVFGLAHLFRLQSFLLNPNGSWNSLLKPDILNILGLGLVLTAWLWSKSGERWRSHAAWLMVPAAVVIVCTPLAPTWWWPTLLHPRLEAYIRPVGNNGVFSLFPTIFYVLVGAFVGARLTASRERLGRYHVHVAMWGGVALLAAWILGYPWLAGLGPWRGVGSAVLGRAGGMLVITACAWAMFRRWPAGRPSRMALLGQTSLVVYWVHVELAYGVFSVALHQRLALSWSIVGYLLMVVAMYGVSVLWAGRRRGPLVPEHMAAPLASLGTPDGRSTNGPHVWFSV